MNWFDMLATCPASSCTTAQPPLSLCGPKDNVEILNLAAELAIDLKRENSLDQLELILGRPVFFENHWTCMFVINGLLPGPEIVTAGESLHALCLAIRRVHGFLSGVSGQLYSRDQKLSRTLIPLDLQHYFHSKLEP